MCYQTYLEQVLDATEDFTEISDLLKRHTTLMHTYKDLKKQSELNATEADKARSDLQSTLKVGLRLRYGFVCSREPCSFTLSYPQASQTMKLKKHNEIATMQLKVAQGALAAIPRCCCGTRGFALAVYEKLGASPLAVYWV